MQLTLERRAISSLICPPKATLEVFSLPTLKKVSVMSLLSNSAAEKWMCRKATRSEFWGLSTFSDARVHCVKFWIKAAHPNLNGQPSFFQIYFKSRPQNWSLSSVKWLFQKNVDQDQCRKILRLFFPFLGFWCFCNCWLNNNNTLTYEKDEIILDIIVKSYPHQTQTSVPGDCNDRLKSWENI